MDIFEYAMQMEQDGKDYYLKIAEKTSHKGLKAIFEMLANDEVKHYNTLKEMKEEIPGMAETQVLGEAKNIFIKMKENLGEADLQFSEMEVYKHAQELEEKTKNFYLAKSLEVEDEGVKNLFKMLAEEESKHYFLLENIILFVTKPRTWLENAEYYQLDEY
jgi:rubrerythrin